MHQQDKGFSYESPERQRKSGLKLLGAELFVLLVVTIFIVGLLQYSGIINIMDFVNQNKNNVTTQIPEKVIPRDPKGSRITESLIPKATGLPAGTRGNIEVDSQINGYNLVLENNEELIDLLTSWGVYGMYFYDDNSKISDSKPLQTIRVVLTPDPQKGILIADNQNNPYLTFSTKYSLDSMNIFINIATATLQNEKLTAKTRGDFVTHSVLSILYRASKNGEVNQGELENIVKSGIEKGYFLIQKIEQ